MVRVGFRTLASFAMLAVGWSAFGQSQYPTWDTKPDTWVAVDGLNRRVPTGLDVGPPRKNRFVGVFYFLWLGNFDTSDVYDVTKILRQDPLALEKGTSPPWGPYLAPHHWGLSQFGYYRSDDEYVLRKHAQMLSDAGVDVIIFDTSNDVTYRNTYMKLLEVFAQVRAEGGRTPQIAFLCPFGTPGRVVNELYHDLYQPGLYRDLWFQWKGKPLIMADPDRLVDPAHTAAHINPIDITSSNSVGLEFRSEAPIQSVGAEVATYGTTNSEVTETLYRDTTRHAVVEKRRFRFVTDNGRLLIRFKTPLPPGKYYLELSQGKGRVAWWTHRDLRQGEGQSYKDGNPLQTCLSLSLQSVADGIAKEDFFTFRAPQPSYFQGPTKPNMWSWLEVYPQHVFTTADGTREQMSVGVAQNAVGNRLGSMSEVGAKGRNWHNGANDATPGAINYGLNFEEQSQHALKEDPEFVFITGWNEWVAGRFPEFGGVKLPTLFVDEFNEEFSRDIEPMVGGHGDSYYYQMVSFIRKFKGANTQTAAGKPKTIRIDQDFKQWSHVSPEYRDAIGDTMHRDHPGWDAKVRYVNTTGRNDFISLRVSRDRDNVYFYARTKDPITPFTDPHWMMLFINVGDPGRPNWLGYQYVVNRVAATASGLTLEASKGGWNWIPQAKLRYRVVGNELQLAIKRSDLGLNDPSKPLDIQFKWMDNLQHEGDPQDFDLVGDAAPDGRFNYRYFESDRPSDTGLGHERP